MMIAAHVGRWSQAQREQMELCDRVERMAERLPLCDLDAAALVADEIASTLQRVHQFEEEQLFPALEAASPQMRPLLKTFRDHHRRDRLTSEAVNNALAGIASIDSLELKMLKVELLAFVEALRRHVQFEEAITMALFASRRMEERRVVQ
jgi:hypothetical protein